MTNLQGKRVVLGVCGGIAAYKACWLVRDLQRVGAEVRVVMTESAQHFVSPLTLQALSGYTVRSAAFDPDAERAMSHIELARWADYLLIAPATANTMARMAQGLADDLLSTIYLASGAPVLLCPAMNRLMWQHSATQANADILRDRGVYVMEPHEGEQACGEHGSGRLPELDCIIDTLRVLSVVNKLKGRKVLITAGPTREPLDPVRYFSNYSSGKMGYALAKAAQVAGAQVTLVSGPVTLAVPHGISCVMVQSAVEMHEAVMHHLEKDMVVIGCAAVADYRPETSVNQKIKKQTQDMNLTLQQNPDIIADVAADGRAALVIGFAAETENVLAYAKDKRKAKRLDFIIANEVSSNQAFNQEDNKVTIIGDNVQEALPLMPKIELAAQIIAFIAQTLQNSAQ